MELLKPVKSASDNLISQSGPKLGIVGVEVTRRGKSPPHVGAYFFQTRSRRFAGLLLAAVISLNVMPAMAQPKPLTENIRPQWTNAPWSDPHFFPIAVWLQDPSQAGAYRRAGVNTFVGLWDGPTEEQLAALKQAGMRVICAQNDVGLKHRGDPTIIGWMHGDEPDNAQSRGARFGFGSPIPPEKTVADYQRTRSLDPTRPVLLNLGQGVAWDGWFGRGRRNHHPEDYPEYLKGCDIASFDIYPVNHESSEVHGKLWFVANGVERLARWSQGKKPVWNCIETTAISRPDHKPTPEQVRAEVWMSLVHGSRGLIYFCHQFKPTSDNAALLHDPEMLAAVTRINRQISQLAPVLNSPTVQGVVRVQSKNPDVPVDVMVKQTGAVIYIFAVAMRDGATDATFVLPGVKDGTSAEVLGENRAVAVKNSSFTEHFGGWAVHLYRLPAANKP